MLVTQGRTKPRRTSWSGAPSRREATCSLPRWTAPVRTGLLALDLLAWHLLARPACQCETLNGWISKGAKVTGWGTRSALDLSSGPSWSNLGLVDGMTGLDLAREVQALQPELVVHLVSGYADNVDIDPGHVRLAKPFRAEELAASLRDVRNSEKLTALAQAGAEVVEGDLNDSASIDIAMKGVSSVVLVSPAIPEQELRVVDSAVGAGVDHVVKITGKASADSPIARRRGQNEIEEGLIASGLGYTLLRNNTYMQNMLMAAPSIIKTNSFGFRGARRSHRND